MSSSPEISICSLDEAELISVAEAAEKTFSQQQLSSQACNDQVEEEEEEPVDQLHTKIPENGSSISETLKTDRSDSIPTKREDIKLKRKANFFDVDVKPQSKRSNMADHSTGSEGKDIKPLTLDLTVDSKPTKFKYRDHMLNRSNGGYIDLDKKPIDLDQIEEIKKKNERKTRNNSSNSAEKILSDFNRRICNSIYRLNKSLLDLPSSNNQQQILKLFNCKNVQDHVNLLVKESFYNPHIIDNSADNHRQAPHNSISYDFNNAPIDFFGSSFPGRNRDNEIDHFTEVDRDSDLVDQDNLSSSMFERDGMEDDGYEGYGYDGCYYTSAL